MQPRTTTTTVTFAHPFRIPGIEEDLPAGSYDFLVEEELFHGLSFEAFHRTASWLMVGGRAGSGGVREMRALSPRDLDAALDRDRATTDRDDVAPSSPTDLS